MPLRNAGTNPGGCAVSGPIKVRIDRSRWLRGEGSDDSFLLRPRDGRMCCLGFCALAMGLNEDDIRNVYEPEDVGRWPEISASESTRLDQAMRTNDEVEMCDTDRERELKGHLDGMFDLEFYDGEVAGAMRLGEGAV